MINYINLRNYNLKFNKNVISKINLICLNKKLQVNLEK